MRTTVIALSITLAATLLVASPASARQVVVEVTSIEAFVRPVEQRTDGEVEVDQRLVPISKSLKSLFAYDSYKFLGKERASIELAKAHVFRLPEHFAIEISPDRAGRSGQDMIGMKVTLFKEEPRREGRRSEQSEREVVLRTEIRLKSGGTMLLGGPPIRSGVLVLALSAKQ